MANSPERDSQLSEKLIRELASLEQ